MVCKYLELFYCIFYIINEHILWFSCDLYESEIIVLCLAWFLWFWYCHCVMPVILTSSLCQISHFNAFWLVNLIIGYLFINGLECPDKNIYQSFLSDIYWYFITLLGHVHGSSKCCGNSTNVLSTCFWDMSLPWVLFISSHNWSFSGIHVKWCSLFLSPSLT